MNGWKSAVPSFVRRLKSKPKEHPFIGRFDKLNFGCGYDKRAGYLNIDMDPVCNPDLLIRDGDLSIIPRNAFSEVVAKDVIEHVPRTRTLSLLLDLADFLRPDGELVLQTTSILHVASKLIGTRSFNDHYGWTICLFGTQAHAGDFHFSGFTETTLRVHLLAAGFTINLCEVREDWMFYVEARKTGDWTEALAFSGEDLIRQAYLLALHREASADEVGIHLRNLQNNDASRKTFLRDVFSSHERLSATATRHGL